MAGPRFCSRRLLRLFPYTHSRVSLLHQSALLAQVFSSGNVGEGAGVYWMFYSGGNFEADSLPAGLLQGTAEAEGARRALAVHIDQLATAKGICQTALLCCM